MPRKTAMLLSGIITAFALMVVVGLVYGANRYGASAAGQNQPTTAPSAPADVAAPAEQVLTGSNSHNSSASAADVAALQAQVQTYRQQLQQAYSDLQQAYDQIQTLNNSLTQGPGGRLRGGEGNERQRQFGGQGLFGSDD